MTHLARSRSCRRDKSRNRLRNRSQIRRFFKDHTIDSTRLRWCRWPNAIRAKNPLFCEFVLQRRVNPVLCGEIIVKKYRKKPWASIKSVDAFFEVKQMAQIHEMAHSSTCCGRLARLQAFGVFATTSCKARPELVQHLEGDVPEIQRRERSVAQHPVPRTASDPISPRMLLRITSEEVVEKKKNSWPYLNKKLWSRE